MQDGKKRLMNFQCTSKLSKEIVGQFSNDETYHAEEKHILVNILNNL